jgi:quinol monooxygenase YgiN
VQTEAGYLHYELSRISGSDIHSVLNESWTSEEHLLQHNEKAYMKEADVMSLAFREGPITVLKLSNI